MTFFFNDQVMSFRFDQYLNIEKNRGGKTMIAEEEESVMAVKKITRE